MENVIVLGFTGPEQAEDALAGLQRLDDADELRLEAAAVLVRTAEGRIEERDLAEDFHFRATAAAGLMGALIGALTGPIGVVIGGATGAAVGSLVDVADAESSEELLRVFAQTVPPGSAATLAVVFERLPAAVDRLASDLGGTVRRRPRAEVEREIVEAEEAAIASQREADADRGLGERLRDAKDALLDRH